MTALSSLLLALLLQVAPPTPLPYQVVVTVLDAGGRPVVEQEVQLTVHVPLVREACTTDDSGRCTMTFAAAAAENDLLRGGLLLVGRGRRSLIWKGTRLEVTVQLSPSGRVELPADFHPPPATVTRPVPVVTATVAVTAATPLAAPATPGPGIDPTPAIIPLVDDDDSTGAELEAEAGLEAEGEAGPEATTDVAVTSVGAGEGDGSAADDSAGVPPWLLTAGRCLLVLLALALGGGGTWLAVRRLLRPAGTEETTP